MLGLFVASRSLGAAAGIRFDATTLDSSWQFIDPDLLRHHLAQSLYYSHTQPPLFNLLLGLVLKFSPFPDGVSFQLVFLAMGLGLTLTVFALSRALGARRLAAVAITAVATCSPAALLYENWLFYTYPEALLVTVVALAVYRWVDTGRQAWLITVGVSAMALVLTRSLFHPLWYVVVAALAWLGRRPARRRQGLLALGLPLIVVLAVVAKNQLLFDSPGLSSWLGMNLWRVSTEQLPDSTRQQMVADGRLSAQSALQSFQTYERYAPVVRPCTPAHPGIGVLGQARKSTGWVNYNFECFLPIYRQAQRDALTAAREDPGSTLASQVASWQLSLMPASDYPYLTTNRSKISRYEDLYNAAALVQVGTPTLVAAPNNERDLYQSPIGISLTIVAAFGAVLASAIASLRRWRTEPTGHAGHRHPGVRGPHDGDGVRRGQRPRDPREQPVPLGGRARDAGRAGHRRPAARRPLPRRSPGPHRLDDLTATNLDRWHSAGDGAVDLGVDRLGHRVGQPRQALQLVEAGLLDRAHAAQLLDQSLLAGRARGRSPRRAPRWSCACPGSWRW